MEIDKKQILFARNESGSLIPQDVKLEGIEGDMTIKAVPLTRGRMQEIYQKTMSGNIEEKVKADGDIIKFGLISPVLTNEEIEDLKPQMATAITTAILAISLGISQSEIGKKTSQVIADQEYLLAKK